MATPARRRRSTREGAIVAVAAIVALVGALTGCAATDAETAHKQPAPAQSADAADGAAVLGTVTHDPLLPVAEPLSEGMLEAAGPGWSLVTYYDNVGLVEGMRKPHPTVLYLVSPDGKLYEVPTTTRLVDDQGFPAIRDWLAGTSLVLRQLPSEQDCVFNYNVVDLLTGETVFALDAPTASGTIATFAGDGSSDLLVWQVSTCPGDGPGTIPVDSLGRYQLDGAVVAHTDGFEANAYGDHLVSPDGERIVLSTTDRSWVVNTSDLSEIASLATPSSYASGACTPVAWFQDGVAIFCTNEAADGEIDESYGVPVVVSFDVWVAGLDGSLTQLASGVSPDYQWMPYVLDDRLVMCEQWGNGPCIGLTPDGTSTDLPGGGLGGEANYLFGVAEGRAFATTQPYPTDGLGSDLLSVDFLTGDTRVLVSGTESGSALGVVVLPG